MTRSRQSHRTEANLRKHHLALAFRVAPMLLLVIGFFAMTSLMSTATAQFPMPRLPNGQASGGQFPGATGRPIPNPQIPGTQLRGTQIPSTQIPGTQGPAFRQAAVPAQSPATYPGQPNNLTAIPAATDPASAGPTEQDSTGTGFSLDSLPAPIKKLAQGGWLMIPLGVCSLVVFSLSMERLIALRRGRVIPRPFVRRFTECVEDGQLSYEEATEICEEFDCPVAEVFRAAVRRWGRPMLEIEQAVLDAGDRVGDGLKRFVRVFHAISNVAPLLGLLGTVLGMIEAFEMISSEESMGRPEMLASGISMALITTAAGLSVAIPAYLAYMYFSSKSDRYLVEIDKLCTKVVDSISAEALESGNGAGARRKKRAA